MIKTLNQYRTMVGMLWVGALAALVVPARAQSDNWQTLTPQTDCTARHEAALTALHGKLYLLGGRGIKPVEEYDPGANTWRKLAPTPMEFHHFQAVVLNDKIAVIGAMTGKYPHEQPLTNVWLFDPKKNEWSQGVEIPAGRRRGGAGVVVDEEKVYLVCGITNGHWNGFIPWLDVWNVKSGQWSVLPDAPRPRDHFQAALLDGKIVAAGGRTTYGETKQVFNLTISEVDVYDIAKNNWTTLAAGLPTPRAGCMAAVRAGKVIIVGGESTAQGNAHSEVQALTVATGKWESLPSLNQGRHGTGVPFIGDDCYVAAGCSKRGGGAEINSVEKLHLPAAKP